MSKRTITLTNRAPVTIDEDNWPTIAEATDSEHDGEVECQATRKSKWSVRVRKHSDGRAIVYATYSYDTNWRNARCYSAKRGILVASGGDLVAAIREVCDDIAYAECDEEDAERWPTLAAECIANLPAEELD
ncbi:MAG: hypothetical protein PHU85_02315 [Phycisphaerae bacterium]|nr:hypothetical protein [Phycisphaerae bacterium]